MSEIRLDYKNGTLWYGEYNLGVEDIAAACRRLLELDLTDLDNTVVTYRGDTPCVRCSVKWGSTHEITTSAVGTPTFSKIGPVRASRAEKRKLAGGKASRK